MRAETTPDFSLEWSLAAQGCSVIAGVDEVGRGCWAGPLVAAAVVLPLGTGDEWSGRWSMVRDSKVLTAELRLEAFTVIRRDAEAIGIGWVSSSTIDNIGLGPANRRAMSLAVHNLGLSPDALIVDYLHLPHLDVAQLSPPRAEATSLSVAAASIVAKVMRDRLMARWDMHCPGYGFAANKGYGTSAHREGLDRLGPCRIHRMSFAPVARHLSL